MGNAKGKDTEKHGGDFISERQAVDKAINERMKSERNDDKLDPRSANSKTKTRHKPDDSSKKVGRTKH